MIEEFKTSRFSFTDFAFSTTGRWAILKRGDAELARVPEGGNPYEFYGRLAGALKHGPSVPEWSWCLAGDIVQSHTIGPEKTSVPGSRHFAPGTKVYFLDAFWGMGGDRCTVIGIPKYSDYPIGVVIETALIENFRLEKVTDERFLKAMHSERLREEFKRDRSTSLRTWWGQDESDRKDILDLAERMNRYYQNG